MIYLGGGVCAPDNEGMLCHHGVKGMKWGIRRYQPYSVVPRGSGKTGKFVGKTPNVTYNFEGLDVHGYSSGPLSRGHMPQNNENSTLHQELYKTDSIYRQNYDEAAPLRKKYDEAVDREIAQEQKILNGDFGYTGADGKNPKSLDDAYDEWDRLIAESDAAYSATTDKYMEIYDHVVEKLISDKSLRDLKKPSFKEQIKSEAQAAAEQDFQTDFDKKFAKGDREKFLHEISRFPKKQTNPINTFSSKRHRKKQREFENFLKEVPLSEKYKSLSEEISKNGKKLNKAEYDLVDNLVDPAKGKKTYDKLYEKAEKLNRERIAEECRLLGVNENKLDSLAKGYLSEMIATNAREVKHSMNDDILLNPMLDRTVDEIRHSEELRHYGVKGMRWGMHLYANGKELQGAPGGGAVNTEELEKNINDSEVELGKIREEERYAGDPAVRRSKKQEADKLERKIQADKKRVQRIKKLADAVASDIEHAFNDSDDTLYHFGIAGMKWGKRNGPPYPLKAGAKSSAEKKAERQKRKAEKFEAKKQKALRGGTIEQVMKFRGSITNEELQYAISRIELEKKLTRLEQPKVNNGKTIAKKILVGSGKLAVKGLKGAGKLAIKTAEKNKVKKQEKIKAKEREEIRKIIRTGSQKQILKNAGRMTNDDLQEAFKRLEWENKIRDLNKSGKSKIRKKQLDKLFGNDGMMGSLATYTGNTSKALNNINAIKKALNDPNFTDDGGKKKGND